MTTLATFGEALLRLSTSGDTTVESTDSFDVYVGGAEANVAVAAQRLGVDSTFLSKLPDSPLGRKVTASLRSHGVTPRIAWDGSADARLGTYYLEQAGAPRGTRVIYDRAGATIRTATEADLATDAISAATAFHVSGITPALSADLARTTKSLLQTATDRTTITTFDLNYRSNLWTPAEARETVEDLFDVVDVLFVPKRDAANVLGYTGNGRTMATVLADEYDFDLVVVTRGAEGATAFADGSIHKQAAFETETADPIGTGDAFVGGFLAKWLQDDQSIPQALEYGAATAALKRTIAGDQVTVTPSVVDRVIENGPTDVAR